MKKNPNNMSLLDRIKAPTPDFFLKLRKVGGAMAAGGLSLLTFKNTQIILPEVLYNVAGYFVAIGTVIMAFTTLPVDKDKLPNQ